VKVKELFEDDQAAKLNDAMMRIRKGSSVSPKQLMQVAIHLGWKVEETRTTYQEKYLNNSSILNRITGVGHGKFNCWDVRDSENPKVYEISAETAADAEEIKEAFNKFLVAKIPDLPKRSDEMYVQNISDIKNNNSNHRPFCFTLEIWFPTKTMVFSDDKGNVEKVITRVSQLGYDFLDFNRTQMYQDIKAAVIEKLGLGSLDAERAKRAEAAKLAAMGENSGHCAICGALQKLRKAGDLYAMVHHGYQRPGYGYIVGDCFGVHRQPYEKSADACIAYMPILQQYLKKSEKKLDNLKTGKVRSFTNPSRVHGKPDEVVVPGDENWDSLLKMHIAHTERDISYINKDIEHMQNKIDSWELKPLPFEAK